MRILLITLFLSMHLFAFAQDKEDKKAERSALSKYFNESSYQLAIMNVGIGMPPNFVNGRLHPGASIGLQHGINKSKFNYHFHLGYFSIPSLERVTYLKPGIGYNIGITNGWSIRPSLNYAFMVVQQINDEFKYVGNGKYEQVSRFRMQMNPGFGLETFIKVAKSKMYTYEAMLGYEFGVQLPFSTISKILPLNQLKFGVRLFKNNNK